MPLLSRRHIMAAALALPACATARRGPSLEEILHNHVAARGGRANLDAVRTVLSEATIVEPTFTVQGRYIASKSGHMRVDVYYQGNRGFSEGIDAQGAWAWPGDAPEPVAASPLAHATLERGLEFNLYDLEALATLGHSLRLIGSTVVDGAGFHEIAIRMRDGFETTRFVNAETWLSERQRDFRPLHPDVDPTPLPIDTLYSDFRWIGPVRTHFAWREINGLNGEEMQRGNVRRLEYNVSPDTLNFDRSAALRPPAGP